MSEADSTSIIGVNPQSRLTDRSFRQRWCKPTVCIKRDETHCRRVFKFYRYEAGPFGLYFRLLVSHEYRMLKQVQGLAFAPQGVRRETATASSISYSYIEAKPIKEQFQEGEVPEQFFFKLYQAVRELHARGVAHLDVGNSGNVLTSKDGNPILIDFASAMPLKRLPVMARAWARKQDLLGVLKLWHRFDGSSMPSHFVEYYERHYRRNIYTPKRFLRALRRYSSSNGADLSSTTALAGIFLGLLVLACTV